MKIASGKGEYNDLCTYSPTSLCASQLPLPSFTSHPIPFQAGKSTQKSSPTLLKPPSFHPSPGSVSTLSALASWSGWPSTSLDQQAGWPSAGLGQQPDWLRRLSRQHQQQYNSNCSNYSCKGSPKASISPSFQLISPFYWVKEIIESLWLGTSEQK